MSLSIEEIRALYKKAASEPTNYTSNNNIFSFKDANIGDSIPIRLIEDGEPNDFFYRPRSVRQLYFPAIKLKSGEVVHKDIRVTVPAFNVDAKSIINSNLSPEFIYKSTEDVIQQRVKDFWGETDEAKKLYNRYKRKVTYIFQGFVTKEGYEKDKVYRFVITQSLMPIINSYVSMTEREMPYLPTDEEHGRDFIINVQKKLVSKNGITSNDKDYSTSRWGMVESPLSSAQKSAEKYKLSDFIFKKPTPTEEQAMIELFEASFNDEAYDVEKWYTIFKPDNVYFDSEGNIKDRFTIFGESSPQPQTEVPTSTTKAKITEIANSKVESPKEADVYLNEKTSQPNVRELIKDNVETVDATDTNDVVKSLLAKINNKN